MKRVISVLKQVEQRIVPGLAVVLALVAGYFYGMQATQAPALTAGDVKRAATEAMVPVRNDVRDLAARLAPPAVAVTPVKTETIEVPPPKPKAKRKRDAGFWGWFQS